MKFYCGRCGNLIDKGKPTGSGYTESGSEIRCEHCGTAFIVDIHTPEDREKLYKDIRRVAHTDYNEHELKIEKERLASETIEAYVENTTTGDDGIEVEFVLDLAGDTDDGPDLVLRSKEEAFPYRIDISGEEMSKILYVFMKFLVQQMR